MGTANTDWQRRVLFHRTALSHDHNTQPYPGAVKTAAYRVSVGFTNQERYLEKF